MKRQKIILAVVALIMIGGAAGLLLQAKKSQKLGLPGVKTAALPGSRNLEVILPAQVLDYSSQVITQQELVVATLPKDTSYGQRMYRAPDGFQTQLSVVLMGSDRTSHHKPQFCLEGAGWKIDHAGSRDESIPIERPEAYNLPVIKLLVSREFEDHGEVKKYRGVFVYWFVADGALSADRTGLHRLWSGAKKLLTTGELQRWAYVMYFSACPPGEEEATFERMKKFIAASVPEFQLTPKPRENLAAFQP